MKTICIENNGGGLSFEQYDEEGNIISVAANLEFAPEGMGVEDIQNFGFSWYWNDCGGNTVGYSLDDNTSGDTHSATGNILTAADVKDYYDSSQIVAECVDGGEVVLYPEIMWDQLQFCIFLVIVILDK